jgi:uncharacterized protein (DUF885 family)
MKTANALLTVFLALGVTALPPHFAQAADAAAVSADSGKALAKLFDDYIEAWLPLNPLSATRLGDHRYDDRFPDTLSDAYRKELAGLYSRYLGAAQRVDPAPLTAQDRLSLAIFRWELTNRLALMQNDDYLRPVHQMDAVPSQFAVLGSGQGVHPFKSVRDYDNFLRRIDGFSRWTDSAIANMRVGLKQASTQPRILMERTLPQLQAMLVEDVTESLFYRPVANMPGDFSAADKARLTAAYTKAIREQVIPAYRKLHEFIKSEYIAGCRTTAGIDSVPDGAAQYVRAARFYTTTDMTPTQIHELGLRMIRETKQEMEAIKKQVGFEGDLKAFNAYVKSDPKFYPFTSDEQALANYRRIGDTVDANMHRLFGLSPRAKFEVRATEKFRAANASAQYVPGNRDGSRQGVFYVPILDARKFTSIGTETLFLHEAVPGHHFQVSLQQELDLPRFRQYVFYSAFGEGWAVYGETLGSELGLFKDPYQEYGRLIGQLRGATSLAVDTGLHARAWSREQALAFFRDNAIGSEELAENRIDRYMAWPAQTLSYLIGMSKMLELRTRAQQALKEKFDLRDFHDEVLRDGNMPLAVLEEKIDRWIAERKSHGS